MTLHDSRAASIARCAARTRPVGSAPVKKDDAPPIDAAGARIGDALADHLRRAELFGAHAQRLESLGNRISFGRLGAFGAAVVVGVAGISQSSVPMLAGGVALLALFAGLVGWHWRVLARRDAERLRQEVHLRHIQRLTNRWLELRSTGEGLVVADHAYALDIDLVGKGSLFQRIDVTHTMAGASTLAAWLGEAAAPDALRARQVAVRELAPNVDFRQELEAAARTVAGDEKLDPAPFRQFARRAEFFAGRGPLIALIHVLPPVTVGLWAAWLWGPLPPWTWLIPLAIEVVVVLGTARTVNDAFDLIAARRGYVDAFQRMLLLVEQARFEAPALREIQERISPGGTPPSAHLARLDRWAGLAELRTQFPIHFFVNFFLLWDLHVLLRLERWNRDVGRSMDVVFDAIGELEALASFATLAHGDPAATFPDVVASDQPFVAREIAHPLLPADKRVANDIELGGPGTALIVTGSNMAGKSTLLRAVGTNIALALAGGPVIAREMRVPLVRLRASMRADDSLQRGASYFHAELTKLRRVVETADERPPVFFLLDELLRGTNARARHLGARAVVDHLLARGATGMVATHDVALSALEAERDGRVRNAHFTDVMIDGEMTFDYKLRPGVVRTSNALRLLKMAGIDVPDDVDPLAAEISDKSL